MCVCLYVVPSVVVSVVGFVVFRLPLAAFGAVSVSWFASGSRVSGGGGGSSG